jgi:hypothetical protein
MNISKSECILVHPTRVDIGDTRSARYLSESEMYIVTYRNMKHTQTRLRYAIRVAKAKHIGNMSVA